MTPRFERVSELFLAARALPERERVPFLDRECSGDDALRDEVVAWLATEGRPLPLEDLGERIRPSTDPERPAPDGDSLILESGMSGSRESEEDEGPIDRYRLLEKLGEGGFGTVHLAEQSSPFRRLVALKVLKPGMDSRQVIARFEAERQALARMDHPNITRILDSGTTQRGRPYFVMDLVRGVPITEYVRSEKLGPRRILELMLQVCRAVHHAHQKGILHRDLKPSNVLVTIHDGLPVPKVIDFGIAKALHGRLTDLTVFTHCRQFIGTPAYMSPEQAEMSGLDVDTRSDIYSLGVLLYELLTGVTPIEKAKLARCSHSDVQRLLREFEPQTPSRRLSSITSSTSSIEHSVQATIERGHDLARQVRGDIDWIVMRCLEKDRTRRYSSADALAADIERYLRDEPVDAGPPGILYRASKYIRRHRVFVVSAAAIAATLMIGLLVSVVGWKEAARQRDRAMSAREDAMNEAKRANTVVGLLLDMFSGADPTSSRAQSDSLRRLLDDFTAMQTGDLDAEPGVLYSVDLVVGKAYLSLGELAKAHSRAIDAVDTARRLHGPNHLDVARALDLLGMIELRTGKKDEAERSVSDALAIKRRLLDPRSDEIASTLSDLAAVRRAQMRYTDSLALAQEAVSIERAIHGNEHEIVGSALLGLAASYVDLGALADAENAATEAHDVYVRTLRPDHPFVATALERLSSIKSMRGDSRRAEELIRESLELRVRVLGDAHYEVAVARANLALILRARGDHEHAIDLLERARASTIAAFGEESSQAAAMTGSLGTTLFLASRTDEAEQLLRTSIRVLRNTLGEDSVELANQLSNLANLLSGRGEHDEAAQFAKAALATRRKHYGESHQATAFALLTLAEIERRRGLLEEAENHTREGVRSLEAAVGKNHPAYARAQASLARVLRLRGSLPTALVAASEAASIGRRVLPNPHPELVTILEELALTRSAQGDHEGAAAAFAETIAVAEALHGSEHREVFELRSRLGAEWVEVGRFEEATDLLMRSHTALEHDSEVTADTIHASIARLLRLCERTGRTEEAAAWRAKLGMP